MANQRQLETVVSGRFTHDLATVTALMQSADKRFDGLYLITDTLEIGLIRRHPDNRQLGPGNIDADTQTVSKKFYGGCFFMVFMYPCSW